LHKHKKIIDTFSDVLDSTKAAEVTDDYCTLMQMQYNTLLITPFILAKY